MRPPIMMPTSNHRTTKSQVGPDVRVYYELIMRLRVRSMAGKRFPRQASVFFRRAYDDRIYDSFAMPLSVLVPVLAQRRIR